jgi:hypothetical protein
MLNTSIPAEYRAPRCPEGEHELTLYPEWSDDEPVVCHFEHIPGEAQTLEYPGCAEEVNLISAYVRGWDCYRLLSRKQIADLECKFAEHEPEYEP